MVGIKHESMRKGQTSHKKEHNTRMCFPLKPVFTRDKGGLPNFMDEPTVAVDPQSRNRILEGIQELNKQGATIIYTSHYMEEVEQICSRIAIMDHGRSVVVGTKEQLTGMIKIGEKVTIEAVVLREEQIARIRELPHVFSVDYQNNTLALQCTEAKHNLVRILHCLEEQGATFGRVYSELPTLNDVFLEITGKQLRD